MKNIKKLFVLYTRFVFNRYLNQNKFKNKGKNNAINLNNCIVKNLNTKISNNNNTISVEENTILSNCNIDINGNNNVIRIGKNCRINKTEFWIKGDNCIIDLKDGIYIRSSHVACGNKNNIIEIGYKCLIAYNVEIRNNDSHKIYDITTHELINNPRDIYIGDKVWIGGNSTILKGVKIGNESVIGGGSIVTKDVDNNSIYVGIPAKKVKSGIYWEA